MPCGGFLTLSHPHIYTSQNDVVVELGIGHGLLHGACLTPVS